MTTDITPIRPPSADVQFQEAAAAQPIAQPTLPAVIVGVCRDIVPLQDANGNLSADALADLPAFKTIVTNPTFVSGSNLPAELHVRVNDGPWQIVEFTLPGTYTFEQLAAVLNDGLVGAVAIVRETHVIVQTNLTGSTAKLEIRSQSEVESGGTPPYAANLLLWPDELGAGTVHYGQTRYYNHRITFEDIHLPDPLGIGYDNRVVDMDELKAYIRKAGVAIELKRDEGLLCNATRPKSSSEPYGGPAAYLQDYTMAVEDDGDGDVTSPRLYAAGGDASVSLSDTGWEIEFSARSNQASDSAYYGSYHGEQGNDLSIEISVTGALSSGIVVSETTDSVLITVESGAGLTVQDVVDAIQNDAALTKIWAEVVTGPTVAVTSQGPSDLSGGYDPINFRSTGTVCTVLGTEDLSSGWTALGTEKFAVRINGGSLLEMVFPAATYADASEVATAINDGLGLTGFASASGNYLLLTAPTDGYIGMDSTLEMPDIDGSANADILGAEYADGGNYYGMPAEAEFGDQVFLNGTSVGTIREIRSLFVGDKEFQYGLLVVSTEIVTTVTQTSWYILAKNLEDGLTNRPSPNMVVEDTSVTLKHNAIVDRAGVPIPEPGYWLYLPNMALRLDISTKGGERASLTPINSVSEAASYLGDPSIDNPLGLAAYLALSEMTSTKIYVLGIDEISALQPYGTSAAVARALTALEAYRVHPIAFLTDDEESAALIAASVVANNGVEEGRYRMAFLNLPSPTEKVPSLLDSGGATSSGATISFDPGEVNLLDAFGDYASPGAVDASVGLYLTIANVEGKFSIASYDSTANTLTVRTTGWEIGENDDGFYETSLYSDFIDQTVSLYKRGDAFASLEEEAYAIAQRSAKFADPAVISMFPDEVGIPLNGQEVLVPGFYACAVTAAKIAGSRYDRPFTNVPYATFTRVVGSQDRFNSAHLNIIAGGGTWILVQDNEFSPVKTRMQLTTDVSTKIRREASLTRLQHFIAFFYKDLVRRYLGSNNITDSFRENLQMLLDSGRRYLSEEKKYVRNIQFTTLKEDPDNPDSLLAEMEVTLPYPFNRITFTFTLI